MKLLPPILSKPLIIALAREIIRFFVGQTMKASGGKVNPGQLNELLKKKLQG